MRRKSKRAVASAHLMSFHRVNAKKAAEGWFVHLGRGGTTKVVTVERACNDYVDHVRGAGAKKRADDIGARFRRWVYADEIASIELPKLSRKHVEDWRSRLAMSPVKIDPHAKIPRLRERSPSSVNRDATALRAALNRAYDVGATTNDMAWRVALRPTENADGRRDVYLAGEDRRKLLDACAADIAPFLTGLTKVHLRPGALASLQVKHLNTNLGVLTVGKDKAGQERRIKLPETTLAFFAEQAKGKLSVEPLFTRPNGKPWTKDDWKRPVKDAVQRSGLPTKVTAYTLRHSVITDLVTGGLDLLTVAQLSGTSVAMIEKHYGHLQAEHAAAALAGLSV